MLQGFGPPLLHISHALYSKAPFDSQSINTILELFYDRGNHYEFSSLQQDLAVPGELRASTTLDFEFKNVEKMYESYHGINVKLRYFIRVTILRRLADVVKERDIWVYSYVMPTESANSSIKMEVGIEDCLHIEFEYNRSK
jgi:vacuolar protein sorting-associated protein 26